MNTKKIFAYIVLAVIVCSIGLTALTVLQSNNPVNNTMVSKQDTKETKQVSKAIQAVLDEGYKNPVVTGVPLLSCGEGDSIFTSKKVRAINVNNVEVDLTVCCGVMFKGCTIRH